MSAGRAAAADFVLGFDGCPLAVSGEPGEVKAFDVHATLTTENNESPDGAQGWVLSIAIEGVAARSVSVKGVKVSTLFDHDGDLLDPDTGLPNPNATPLIDYELDLFDAGFKPGVTGGQRIPGEYPNSPVPRTRGVVSAIVLHQTQKMVLQPEGTQRILRLGCEGRIPEIPGCAEATLTYMDGLLKGTGQPVDNVITSGGQSHKPRTRDCTILLCATQFRRGDANSDGAVDISDAITALSFLFLGGATPLCLGAADANDDGKVDIADAIFLLTDLFGTGEGTRIPAPGPFTCGPDARPDGLTCESHPPCPP